MTSVWLAIIGAILVCEAIALLNKQPGDTLSEHVWRWFAIRGSGRWRRLRRLALLIIMVWLAAHFLTGGWV